MDMSKAAQQAKNAYKREWNRKRRNETQETETTEKNEVEKMAISESARAIRQAYKREWNKRNKDKVKAAQARYWERKAAAQTQPARDPAEREV